MWQVEESFEHEAAFEAHQKRVASSEWGQATAGIERRYSVIGLQPLVLSATDTAPGIGLVPVQDSH